MNFKDYQEESKKTVSELGDNFLDQLHMAVGMVTESAEILDAYKKSFAYGKNLDVVNVKEELGDLFWYMSNLMRILDIELEDVLDTNVKKLRFRYGKEFSSDNAINRDLDGERKILESDSV